jgi:hypothetical protein
MSSTLPWVVDHLSLVNFNHQFEIIVWFPWFVVDYLSIIYIYKVLFHPALATVFILCLSREALHDICGQSSDFYGVEDDLFVVDTHDLPGRDWS